MDETLITMFTERAEAQDAEVLRVNSGDLSAAIENIVRESGLATFSISEGLAHRIKEALSGEGLAEASQPTDIAVTGAAWAVAETGSLLIRGSRRGFMTSEMHVAVVDASSILRDLDDIPFGMEAEPFLTIITGPSRTADIERVLVLGAHGPRRLVVLIVTE
jgi:L-lactate dehydrogenase complex protein LldG